MPSQKNAGLFRAHFAFANHLKAGLTDYFIALDLPTFGLFSLNGTTMEQESMAIELPDMIPVFIFYCTSCLCNDLSSQCFVSFKNDEKRSIKGAGASGLNPKALDELGLFLG